ncbi:hypothetical protein HMPREF2550_08485 [Corynebacterium sp. HMSC074A01]|nr:hypothetical protein HMPREF2550_08485 [Corynebacterium sp. HMSC074A01]
MLVATAEDGVDVVAVVDVGLSAGFAGRVVHGQRDSDGVGSSTSTGVGVVDEVVATVEDSCAVVLVGVAGFCVDDFGVVACDVVAEAAEVAFDVVVGESGFCVDDFGVVASVLVVEAEVVARTVDICDVEDFGAEVVARVVDFCDVVVETTGFCVDGFCVISRVVVVGAVVVSRAVDFCEVVVGADVVARVVGFCEVVVLVVATGFCVDDCDVAVCVVGVGFAVGVTRCVVNVGEDVVVVFGAEVVEDVVVCEANCSRSSARLVFASRRAAR